MSDSDKTKEALLEELKALRSRVVELQRIEEEYKQTEAELRERQELCSRAEEIAHFSHWERDLVDDKATWSAESYHILGVEPNKFQPSYENFLGLIHPSDRQRMKSALEAAHKEGKGFDIEYRIVRPDGAERVLHSVAEVRFDKSGRPVKLVGTAHDITERKKAEEQLRKAHHELEKRVEERTADLEKTNALLEEHITERKKTEEALREGEERLRLALSAADMGTWRWNPVTNQDTRDASFNRILGLSAAESTQPVEDFLQRVHPDDRDMVDKEIQCAMRDRGPYLAEFRIVRPDGAIRCLRDQGKVLCDENDRVSYMTGAVVDITERKKAEEKIIRAKEEWERTFTAVPDLIAIIDNNYRIVRVNKAMAERMGVAPDEAAGMICYECVHHAKEVPAFCPHTKLLADGQEHAEEIYEEHLGGHFIVSVSPLRDDGGSLVGCVHVAHDITERKRAEGALRESEQRFRSLVETSSDWVWEVDANGIYAYASPKVKDLLGYEPEEIIGKTPFDLMPSDEAKRVAELFKDIVESRRPFDRLENTNLHKDGRLVVLETSGVPILGEGKNLLGYRGIDRDITERKKAEEELLFKSTLLQAQSETSIDGILVVDSEGKSISFNKNFGRMWNIPQQILDTRDDERMLQYVLDQLENPGQFLEKVRYLYTHKNEKSRDEIQFRDGRVFDRYSSPLLDSNNEYYGRVWYFRDITEQKKAEETLRESEERHKALFEGAAEGILVAESETKRFKYANPAICEMLGYTGGELTRMGLRDIHPKDSLDHVISEFEAQAKREKALAPNIPCLRRDGTIMYADVNTALVVIDGRKCNVGFFTDITERKKAEEALQKAHDELEVRVEQRTAELAKAIEELQNEISERKTAQEKLRYLAKELTLAEERLRRRIATDVHDHIGQNLAISKIKLESLRETTSSPELTASLEEICQLIAQIIESSRSLTFELSPPVLYELGFEAAVEWLVRHARQKHGLSTDFKSDGRPKPLSDDIRVLLFQAVRELLVNVAKHAQARNATVSTRKVGNQIQVTVEDDGVGFDTSKISSRDYKTSGFGLLSIRERLRSIGGRFEIDSKPGRGTRVTLTAQIDYESENERGERK